MLNASIVPSPLPRRLLTDDLGRRQDVSEVKRHWRDYRTSSGARPVRDFIMGCESEDRAAIAAAMYDIRANGNKDGGGRHLQGPIWEVRVDGKAVIYRVLFATVGSRGRILLSLHAFKKKTQKTPKSAIDLAQRRLADWERRGTNAH